MGFLNKILHLKEINTVLKCLTSIQLYWIVCSEIISLMYLCNPHGMSATDNNHVVENSRIGPSIVYRNRSLGVQYDTIPKPASGFLQLLTLWDLHCP